MAFQTLSPGTLLSPVPAVMVSCALPGKRPNVITVAWAGTVCSDPPMLSISVRKERFSHHILLESGEFVVNLVGREQLQAADYCGVRSGRDVDKFADCGLTAVPAQGMDCVPAVFGLQNAAGDRAGLARSVHREDCGHGRARGAAG